MATIVPEIENTRCQSSGEASVGDSLGDLVRRGLSGSPKSLPPWLFYDEAGSLLFEAITRLPEYYLTRLERGILQRNAVEMLAAAAAGKSLRVLELGAGSADKTRTLLAAAVARQGSVRYQPVDVSATALDAARVRLQSELPQVTVEPLVADYVHGLELAPCGPEEHRLALFIGSSIGNFAPEDALDLLTGLCAALVPGDHLLLGVDLAPAPAGKSEADLMAAYDDSEGVTAAFNLNLLTRLNRELGAGFDLDSFAHAIVWNRECSRIEMHLESLTDQSVRIDALGTTFTFSEGETIHTENSYKYRPGQAEELLRATGFTAVQRWTDPDGWFAVYLAKRD